MRPKITVFEPPTLIEQYKKNNYDFKIIHLRSCYVLTHFYDKVKVYVTQ